MSITIMAKPAPAVMITGKTTAAAAVTIIPMAAR